jgi:hypothetical protein
MRAIDTAVSGLRAERHLPALTRRRWSAGFAVLETDDLLAGYADEVEQRFVDKPESG